MLLRPPLPRPPVLREFGWVGTVTAPETPGTVGIGSSATTAAGPVVGGNRASLITVVLVAVTWPATAAVPPPVTVPSIDRPNVTSGPRQATSTKVGGDGTTKVTVHGPYVTVTPV